MAALVCAGTVADMRPVKQRGDAGIDRTQGADEIAGIRIFRSINGPGGAGNVPLIVTEQAIGRMLRKMPSQMCRCVSTNPGMTIMFEASITSADAWIFG